MTHTPGPWEVQDDCATSIWAGGHYIAETYTDGEANARLIAAAPDLLAALEAIVAICEQLDVPNHQHAQLARFAIAKAKGK